MPTIISMDISDIRFPTSRLLDGSDAMNLDPDYSAAYLRLGTDYPGHPYGYGFVFTIGRGNDVQAAAISLLEPLVLGRDVDEVIQDLGAFSASLNRDSQLRWLGPEKGVIHMAIGAVVNAAWDLAARIAEKPLWRFIADMTPAQLVSQIDFRYLTDALTPDEALAILTDAEPGKAARIADLTARGYAAYTTSPGWLGYDDAKLERLVVEAVEAGFGLIKLKVGRDVDEDIRRVALARRVMGPSVQLAVDANQRWDVPDAIAWIRQLASYDLAWIEEPTSPDDILGHAAIRKGIAPIPVSTGEHTHNRVMFKQLLQAGSVDLIQIDAARVGGVNENLAILLLATKFSIPVYPHAGGVGLCELVQHLAMADFVAISGQMDDRSIEYVDHLHEHFVDPVVINNGRYMAPTAPGFSAEIKAETVADYVFPHGPQWQEPGPINAVE
ncbi:fuconate dehydratase [Nakamurella antarctica]|uniref:Fuconate dehydratase n=1 Tax=Nakamurella antarctica TaxID=1902245 RepID=A0A3G8ZSE0_9ACTN|nr:enolase C-terminal domain-like protein [Nakamurella antarctica]AZI56986.1 fuconate dehydratase [Nakamurella antarctica]